MPQFDLVLYLPIFITFSFLFFIFNIFMNLFILPFFWNIFYFRYMKKQYNLFLTFLSELEILYLANLNKNINFYLEEMCKNIILENSVNNFIYINNFLINLYLKFEVKNDSN